MKALLVASFALGLALLPSTGLAGETTDPATALGPGTFVVVSQDSNQIGRYNVSLFKIENGRIVLKDSADVELGDMNQQTTLTRQSSVERQR